MLFVCCVGVIFICVVVFLMFQYLFVSVVIGVGVLVSGAPFVQPTHISRLASQAQHSLVDIRRFHYGRSFAH